MSVESGSLLAINHLSYGVDCMLLERVETAGMRCALVRLPPTGTRNGSLNGGLQVADYAGFAMLVK
jgi:hypothetical protein